MFNNCVLYISNDEFLCETLTNFAQKRGIQKCQTDYFKV